MIWLERTPCRTGLPTITVRMWLFAELSSSSHVSTSTPFGPSAAMTEGRFAASQASPSARLQPAVVELCVLWQLFGITYTRFGSVPPLMSAARSDHGLSFVWSRFGKSVHGSCLRV